MRLFSIIISVLLLTTSCKNGSEVESATTLKERYTLDWSDEFDYEGLPNPEKWGYEEGYIRNQEAQLYQANNLQNSKVSNGILTITARMDPLNEQNITSASIITKDRKNVLYGRIEMRAKFPTGAGTWPAFWTVGINREQIGWPKCGEIDIVEALGFVPNYLFGSVHKANAEGKDVPLITPYAPSVSANALSNSFHNYAIEWDSTQIAYFFDAIEYAKFSQDMMTPDEWEQFKKPHYIILNLAMGGTSGGTIDTSKFPFTYEIDYVRYYTQK